jgi:hypothetical protein
MSAGKNFRSMLVAIASLARKRLARPAEILAEFDWRPYR